MKEVLEKEFIRLIVQKQQCKLLIGKPTHECK